MSELDLAKGDAGRDSADATAVRCGKQRHIKQVCLRLEPDEYTLIVEAQHMGRYRSLNLWLRRVVVRAAATAIREQRDATQTQTGRTATRDIDCAD